MASLCSFHLGMFCWRICPNSSEFTATFWGGLAEAILCLLAPPLPGCSGPFPLSIVVKSMILGP
jgi:hypothetical protein